MLPKIMKIQLMIVIERGRGSFGPQITRIWTI